MAVADSDGAWERHVYEFLTEPVPDAVRDRTVLTIADVLSATVAGSAIQANETVALNAAFGDGPSSIVGTDRRVDAGQAALMNATAAITPEVEEGHNTGGHVGAGIVSGALALAEQFDADGPTFVDACARAYELCVRTERAIFAMKDRMNAAIPWLVRDPHSTWTTIGPAVAGALCADVEGERLEETFRVAANLAVVSMHDPYREGAPSRNFTAGFSAQAGVNAALVGAAGLQGSRAAMREVYDPLREMHPDTFDRSFADLGEDWEVERNYFKLTPSCRYTHPALGALQSMETPVDPATVERVDVYTFQNAVDLGYADYGNATSAKFSIPYVLARYLSTGDLWIDAFDGASLDDPDVRSLAQRVVLHDAPEYEESFPEHWSARVEVALSDGETLTAECVDPPGDYRRFPGREPLVEKFERLLATRFDEREASAALEALLDARNRKVRALGDALRTDAG